MEFPLRNKISSQDRAALIRLACSLPAGDKNRKAILAGLQKVSSRMEFRLLRLSGGNVKAVHGTSGTSQSRQVGDVGTILNFIGGLAGSEVDPRVAKFVMNWAETSPPGEEIFVENIGGKWVVT
jgi:hypothetical protein